MEEELEFWQRGPIRGIVPSLQPVVHALLQARKEVETALQHFPDSLLWQRPAGVASVGFHLRHLVGVLDRLFAYANGQQLSPEQLLFLQNETKENAHISVKELVEQFNAQADRAIDQLRHTPEGSLQEPRGVGRRQIPSTVMGLLFHAAEHTQRHVGQLLVTARVVVNLPRQS
jgi:uncharacterized damage-inducible protein DinB